MSNLTPFKDRVRSRFRIQCKSYLDACTIFGYYYNQYSACSQDGDNIKINYSNQVLILFRCGDDKTSDLRQTLKHLQESISDVYEIEDNED
jgi:hypothetical protein